MPTYTFEDDFDGPAGSAPDLTKWTYELGGGGHGNNDLETYTNSRANSYLDGNSNLVIAATKTVSGATTTYQSAHLTTLGIFSQLGGHFEARIQLNVQQGIWPAFWLLGQDIHTEGWPYCGEIDILENFGYVQSIQSAVHTGPPTPSVQPLRPVYHATIPDDGNSTYTGRMSAERASHSPATDMNTGAVRYVLPASLRGSSGRAIRTTVA